ncbi:hypothetical protein SAMN05216188_1393 [Lentzea xinjiangensis]|uniref:Cupin domain-containing protein n=1 Tax=Lentzea xinjiangensis TaxID=402600 RepID=A0A1H9WQ94_9PSEU|nr:hypothetical protein [Lentzea xinjiangensis]SES35959.1 hypothetical protein SAMN05216188_1393 [Lentzea xinjiangensis]
MEATYPSAPGDTLVFENDRVRVWSMTLEPGGMFDFHQHHYDHVILWPDSGQAVGQDLGDPNWGISLAVELGFVLFQTVGTAEPLNPHRIRNVGDKAVTHYIIELISERSPSGTHLPRETNGRETFLDENSGG